MDYRSQTNQAIPGCGGAMGTVALATEAASPVRDCITESETLLSDLHNAIDAMERRLDTLVTPSGPMPPAASINTNKPMPATSHVHGRLTILNEGFQHAIQRLQDLHRRIEL